MVLSETKDVISFAQRVNFGLMTTFNICLLFDPIFIKNVIDAVTESGGVYSSGFIHQKGYPNSRGECKANQIVFLNLFLYLTLILKLLPLTSFVLDSLLLAKSTTAFLVGHWHISRKIVSEHLSFSKDEARDGFCEVAAEKNGKLPIKAFTWLITHFSRAGDYVVDLFSENASAIIASMKIARHGIFYGKEEEQEHVRCHLASHVQPRRATEK